MLTEMATINGNMNAKKTFLHASMSLLALLVLCSGRPAPQTNSPAFRQGVAANVELPVHIKAPDGVLSMVADYAAAGDGGVPIYIINKTGSPVVLPNQDGDIYLKLELKDKSGRWVRAQTHRYSDCGNSYGGNSLAPSMHLRVLGYRPTSGDTATVRYALHSSLPLASTEGTGTFLQSDIEAARMDHMSLLHVPRVLRDVFDLEWLDKSLTASDLAERLVLLQQLGGAPALRKNAEAKLQEWKASPASKPDELEALTVFERVLKEPWAEGSSPERLLRHCRGITSDGSAPIGRRALCWRTIGDLAQITFPKQRSRSSTPAPVTDEWIAATRQAATQIANASEPEVLGMKPLLNISLLVDNSLRDIELEPLLKSANGVRTAANAMARRGLGERLCELASQLSMDHQVTAMASVACAGRFHDEDGVENWGGIHIPREKSKAEILWKRVMSQAPLQAADALRYLHPFDRGADAFGVIVEQGLREFWTREVKKQNQTEVALPNGGYSWRLGVDFLAKAKRMQDVPLFLELLAYGGFEPLEGSKNGPDGKSIPYRARRFGVREAAVAALRSMGIQVPDDIVLQADVSDPSHVIAKKAGGER